MQGLHAQDSTNIYSNPSRMFSAYIQVPTVQGSSWVFWKESIRTDTPGSEDHEGQLAIHINSDDPARNAPLCCRVCVAVHDRGAT